MNNSRFPRTTRWQLAAVTLLATLAWPTGAVAAAAHGHQSSSWSGGKWGDPTADSVSKDAYGDNAASKDPGSLFTVEKATNVRAVWAKKDRQNRPDTGKGVAVALLDSGVSPVPGLDAPGKVVYGPDLSVEGNGILADQDTYGHGTFMAGLIAGRGATNPSTDLPSAPAGIQLGVAPDATLLSLKLATADGGTDVTQVIAAIDWVVEHPTLPNGTAVRVINLSYGTASTQDYTVDPLAAAAENAWNHGIVVVTSGGNGGSAAASLTDPAYDPYVIAVGAADSSDRLDGWAHDHTKAAAFSNVSTGRHVDLVGSGNLAGLAARSRVDDRPEQPAGSGLRRPDGPTVPRQRHQPGGCGRVRRGGRPPAGVSDLDAGPGEVRPHAGRRPDQQRESERGRRRDPRPERRLQHRPAPRRHRQHCGAVPRGSGSALPALDRTRINRRGTRWFDAARCRRQPDHRRGRRPGQPVGPPGVAGRVYLVDGLERRPVDGRDLDRGRLEHGRVADLGALDLGPVDLVAMVGRGLVVGALDLGALDLAELDVRSMDIGSMDRVGVVTGHANRAAP